MIGHIEGVVRYLGLGSAIVSSGGVGYKVHLTPDVLGTLIEGKQVGLWTHLAVRENALDLYGFAHRSELQLFEHLIGVSGIGPKSALGILSIASAESLRSAIAAGNASYLTKVSGIGKKTAEKIVLELKEKVGLPGVQESETQIGDTDALEALQSLGYSHTEAREALKMVAHEHTSASIRLREALKILGGSRDSKR